MSTPAASPRRLLIAGLPRSGTTWIAEAISRAPGVFYVMEPDNPDCEPLARYAHDGLLNLPRLQPSDRGPARLAALWDLAFTGGLDGGPQARLLATLAVRAPWLAAAPAVRLLERRNRVPAGGTVVVKSVRVTFSLEWAARRAHAGVLVVRRSPLNTVAGWARLGWGPNQLEDEPRLQALLEPHHLWPCPPQGTEERAMWTLCALTVLQHDVCARHPGWQSVLHEDLCADPVARFAELFARLGLQWSADVAAYLDQSNAEGSGWAVKRLAAQQMDSWRRELSAEQLAAVLPILRAFASAIPDAFEHVDVPDESGAGVP